MSCAGVLHLHGASIGEVSCLLIALENLRFVHPLNGWRILLTYTSNSASSWIEKACADQGVVARRYEKRIIQELGRLRVEHGGANFFLVVAEKDRRPGLLRFYLQYGSICNIEAKPPQSRQSLLLERITKSLKKIDLALVENEAYESGIRRLSTGVEIRRTGTLKAVRQRSGVRAIVDTPRVVFVSVLWQELELLREVIRELEESGVRASFVLVPRYLKKSWLPARDGRRFLARAREYFGNPFLFQVPSDLEQGGDPEARIYIYDNIGEAFEVIRRCNLAVVCGSFRDSFFMKAKGHNVFEPLAAGIPTLIGPRHRNWQSTIEALEQERVLEVTSEEKLPQKIGGILESPNLYKEISERIVENEFLLWNQRTGERVATELADFLGLGR